MMSDNNDLGALPSSTAGLSPTAEPVPVSSPDGASIPNAVLIRCMGGKFCSHAPGTCTATVPQQVVHGDWLIWHTPSPLKSRHMDWHFAHKDFTSERNGDPRSGSADSHEECIETIAFIEDMESDEREAEREEWADNATRTAMRIFNAHDLARALKNLLDVIAINRATRGFASHMHVLAAQSALDGFKQYYGVDLFAKAEGR